VARSASATAIRFHAAITKATVAAAIASASAVAVAGCVTTQQRNARTVLLNERTLATETAVRVSRENPLVRVGDVSLVHSRAGAGFAVRIANTSPRPLTDLPISVGVLGGHGRRLYLNGAASTDYYSTHVPSIAARDQVTWVARTGRQAPAGLRPFALVGVARTPPSTAARTLPRIVATAPRPRAGRLRVALSNESGIPQYGLQVYAVVTKSGHTVAVGRATIAQLRDGARSNVSLILEGRTSGAAVRVYALPTIFH